MKLKLCIDPGHGMANRKPGVFDPGCTRDEINEADIVLQWARSLADACRERGVVYWMTRGLSATTPAPLNKRVAEAQRNGCTHLISLHVNDSYSPKANGTETLVRGPLTDLGRIHPYTVQALAVKHLGLRNRGVVIRDDLAILKHPNSVLLELGFIGSSSDLAAMQCPCCRRDLCNALADFYAPLSR